MTAPHIGNYGVNPEDIESDRIQVAGFIIKEETIIPSNWRSAQSIGNYLRDQEIVGMQGIDTRALTRHIRDQGAMNCIISAVDLDIDSLTKKLSQVPSMSGLDLAQEVTTRKSFHWNNNGSMKKHKVAAIDFGLSLIHI